MARSRLHELSARGVSVWFDTLSRDLLETGELARMIEEDAVVGVTSNPTIFQKALAEGDRYDEQIRELQDVSDPREVFFALAMDDIRAACDLLRPVWDETAGVDGFVSLEVDPTLAYDREATYEQALRFHEEVEPREPVRQDPGHPDRARGDRGLHRAGQVDQRHAHLLAAALRGGRRGVPARARAARGSRRGPGAGQLRRQLLRLPRRHRGGQAPRGAGSHRSAGPAGDREREARLRTLGGRRSPASAGSTSPSKGARSQRCLWASTSTKNPAYRDVMYVEELIGPETVNTMPLETIRAFQDHGEVRGDTLCEGLDEARRLLDELAEAGVDYDDVVDVLEAEGVQKFADSFAELMEGIEAKRAVVAAARSSVTGVARTRSQRDSGCDAGLIPARSSSSARRAISRGASSSRPCTRSPSGACCRSASPSSAWRAPSRRPGSSSRRCATGVKEHARDPYRADVWQSLAAGIRYVSTDFADDRGEDTVGDVLAELDRTRGTAGNRVYYLAVPPQAFETVLREIGERRTREAGWTRVIVEKPFGHDLDSARELTATIRRWFGEEEIFRIDHYLGKETVQNMLALRFANGIFEPIWNRQFIDHVQITVAETMGIEGRAGFYERAGAIRDIFQNHLLQLLALTAMEPPIDFTADSVRNEKVKVLRAMHTPGTEERRARPVRARLGRGGGGAGVPRGAGRRAGLERRRPTSRRSSTSTTGAGRTRRSTCVPASGWRGARRRSRSSSSARRTRRSRRSPGKGCVRTCS